MAVEFASATPQALADAALLPFPLRSPSSPAHCTATCACRLHTVAGGGGGAAASRERQQQPDAQEHDTAVLLRLA